MRNIVLTIGVMAFNEEKYLHETLVSILNQDFNREIEILIGDNASTDKTMEIAKKFSERSDLPVNIEIKYYRHNSNLGSLANYNFLVDEARGNYFILAGAHDLWSDGYLEKMYSAIDNDSSLVLVGPHTVWVDETGLDIDKQTSEYSTYETGSILRFIITICNNQNFLYGILRIEALKKTRLQLQMIGSGAVMLAELALQGNIGFEPNATWYRRVNRNKETAFMRLRRYKGMLFLKKRWRPFPHWAIPWAYFGIAFHAPNTSLWSRFRILFFCLPLVFLVNFHLVLFDVSNLWLKYNARRK